MLHIIILNTKQKMHGTTHKNVFASTAICSLRDCSGFLQIGSHILYYCVYVVILFSCIVYACCTYSLSLYVCVICTYSCYFMYVCTGKEERLWQIVRLIITINHNRCLRYA